MGVPLRTARLSEDQVQSLLAFALRDGGLALARESYQNNMVADAATAIFEIHADGDSKTVSAYALGIEGQPGPDRAILQALAALATRLRDFDQGGTLATAPYQPARYRATLLDAEGVQGVRVRDWPWAALTPSDFASAADPNAPRQAVRVLSPDEVATIGIDKPEGGIQAGLYLRGPDGRTYSLALRPLLPDEEA